MRYTHCLIGKRHKRQMLAKAGGVFFKHKPIIVGKVNKISEVVMFNYLTLD